MHFIFLVYESRSGSTMLAKTIASRSSGLLALPELRVIEVLLAEGDVSLRAMSAAQIVDTLYLDHQLGNLNLSSEQIMNVASRAVGRGVVGIVEELVSAYAASRGFAGLEHVLVKAGGLLYLVRDLQRLFPESHLLHIYRDARGVVNSVIHNTRPYFPDELMGRGDPVFMASSWSRFVRAAAEVRHTCADRFVEIAYEDLCSRSDEIINVVLAELGVERGTLGSGGAYVIGEAERAIHKLVSREPIADRLEAWKEELRPWEGVAIEVVARRQMVERGYQLWFTPRIGKVRALLFLTRAWSVHYWRAAGYYLARLRYYSRDWAKLVNRLKLHRLTKS